MRIRAPRTRNTVIATGAVLFALLLIAVNTRWPAAFAVLITVGGAVGALTVLYEVRLTKRIAQAEFIRDLQSGFASDANIGELWRKLLLKEQITPNDRPLVSSYLTFFETLYLLLKRGALELSLTDDLFRNRFFTAIGDRGVQDTALVSEAGAFANIHELIVLWHAHLLAAGVPIHPGYYSYCRALTEAKGYAVVPLDVADLPGLLELQDEVLHALGDRGWLRANDADMLEECLTKHVAMGVRRDGRLVAAAILFDGGETQENIRVRLSGDPHAHAGSINLKIVLTSSDHRKNGLARTLVELLEQRATELGKREILCTIHGDNTPSQSLFKLLGYGRIGSTRTSYGERDVYARTFPSLEKRWAR